MTVKTPIRTVFDAQNNATGLAEFQSGERVGISHGGTGLASVGTAGQVLAVNANTNGLEYVDSDTATINDRMQVANTQALHTNVTANLNSYIANTNPRISNLLTSVSGTNTAIRTLVSDRMQVANTTTLVNTRMQVANAVSKTSTTGQSMKATLAVDSEGASSGVNIANGAISIFTATGNPAYVDFYCEVSNAHRTRVKSAAHSDYSGNIDLTLPTTAGTLGLDADIKDRMQVANTTTLVNDRMQVANAQSLHTSVTANLNSYIANTNPRIASNDTDISNLLTSVSGTNTAIRSLVTTESGRVDNVLTSISGTNTAIRTLVSDRMQVANTIALANARLGAAATVALTGDVTASATAFSSNAASISTTIASNSVDGSKLTDNITIAKNLVVSGNLTVSGTQTTVNSNEVNIGDAILTLNSDLGSGVAASEDAGISINRGSDSDVSFIYDESENRWSLGSQQLVSGDLIPNSDSAEDLGTTSVRWRKLYADDIDVSNDISVSGDITVSGTINASITGTSDNATALATARSIGLGGDLSGSANFDGSQDITINATIQNNSVALGTDTTGNYVAALTAGALIDVGAAGEGASPTVAVDLTELTDGTADIVGSEDELVYLDNGSQKRKLVSEIKIGQFNTTNQIALGTDTTGNYVQTLAAGNNSIVITGADAEGSTKTVSIGDNIGANTSGKAATAGNADTATALETARNIGGVSFDGSANINLPGVNTTGNQNTSGSAATLTTARSIGLGGDLSGSANFDGSGDITITATIQNNSVALGTDTTGNYVGTLTAGQSLTTSGAATGEGIAHALSLDADARHPAATDVYHGNAHEYIHFDDGNQLLRFYVGNAEDMRLEADGDLHVDGDVVSESTTVSSDEKLKENIEVVENAVEKIHQLRGVEFNWKKSGRKSAGVIAQDVEKVLPQAVKEVRSLAEDEDAYLTVKYDSLHALTIEAIKTMSDEIAALKEEIKILKGE